MIYRLLDDNGTDVEETELKKHITKYYKSLSQHIRIGRVVYS
jgi:hypothetical protein